MKLYIEIKNPNTDELVAGETEVSSEEITFETYKEIAEFAEEQGICPSYALEHCMYKIKF